MSSDTDFLTLYQELGVNPDVCNLSELKQAYRRRVQQLHPDRRTDERTEVPDPERLQRLIRQYRAAIAFERRFGRLPGTGPSPRVNGTGHPPLRRELPRRDARKSVRRRFALIVLILAALAWALWGVGIIEP